MLWEAHDRTVTCSCGFTTYLEAGSCAACDKPFNDVFTIEILASPSSPPVATIAIGSNPVAIQRRHLPLPTEARTRHDDVVQASIEHGAVVLDAATEWSCGTRTLRHGDQTELTNNNGTSMTLRAVAYAS
jgi:hypothetical protein